MLISIITINYNNCIGLERTIVSVQSSDFESFEHLIIDGGSSDNSKQIILKNKELFSYWVSEPDKGIYNAMNKGIYNAKGDYLLFLNSGDVLVSNDTLRNVSHYLDNKYDIYYGNLNYVSEDETNLVEYPEKLKFSYFFNGGYLPHPATFIKKELFYRIGFYNEAYRIIGDWDFFIKALCKYNSTYKRIDVTITNFDNNGISNDPNMYKIIDLEKAESFKNHFSFFTEDYLEFNVLKKKMSLREYRFLDILKNGNKFNKLKAIFYYLFDNN